MVFNGFIMLFNGFSSGLSGFQFRIIWNRLSLTGTFLGMRFGHVRLCFLA